MSDNSTYVDPNTDDLDAFNNLLNGDAKPLVETQDSTEDDEEKPVEDDDSNIEDDALAPEDASDEDDDQESEDDESEDDDEEDTSLLKVKPKKTFQDRINELTAKAKEAERREADLARKLEETIARLDSKKEPAPTPVQRVAEGPTADDANEDGSPKYPLGEFDPNYVADLARFSIRKEFEEAREAEKQQTERARLEQAQAELQTEWNGRIEEASERLPDFRETAQNLESAFSNIDTQYGEYLAGTIMSMEYGPDVLYYLSNNIAEAKKIAASGPTQATIALGRIEARFAFAQEEKKVKKIKVSDAPAPPPTHTKGNKGSRDVPDDTDDLDAFEAKFYKRK